MWIDFAVVQRHWDPVASRAWMTYVRVNCHRIQEFEMSLYMHTEKEARDPNIERFMRKCAQREFDWWEEENVPWNPTRRS
jgi:hypothetical protein